MSTPPADAEPSRSPWRTAAVVQVRPETPTAKTFRLRLPHPSPHVPGQHYVLRLTAPDGYTASRSFSVASAPDDSAEIELTVERLEDGEVSAFLHDVVEVGDDLEIRGPIGGWFVWDGVTPAVLIGGGSGVVPLMSMLRAARRAGTSDRLRLLVSARSPDDLYYAEELPGPETTVIYTRRPPPGHPRPAGRLHLDDVAPLVRPGVTGFVCGGPAFADAAAGLLVAAGLSPREVRVERFGETG